MSKACRIADISPRTVQRWRKHPGSDDRRRGPHHRPHNALSLAEQALIVSVMTSARYAGLPPKQLVPQLADEGLYLASESTLYRLQRRYGLRPKPRLINRRDITRACTVHRAVRPNQVWSWDITRLPTVVRGAYLHLYLIVDVWSRRIMGWCIAEIESATIAAELMQQTCRADNINADGLVLHSDNGAAMRGNTMLATLQQLGVVPSFSRPHVSNDNPYSEALFRTLKYVPTYPKLPFASVHSALRWVSWFVSWYNATHRHSAICYVTPDERHFGYEGKILERRHRLYQAAQCANPERWSGSTRQWRPVGDVVLNPEQGPRRCMETLSRQQS